MKYRTLLYSIGAACLLTGCGTYTRYHRPAELTAQLVADSAAHGTETPAIAGMPWRAYFTDSRLQALISTGLDNNADLQVAALKVTEAEASLMAAQRAYLPALSLSPQGQIGNYGGQAAPKTYNIALSAEWEVDIVGRLTAAKRSAKATAAMYEDARQAVQTQLVATIANHYYHLLMLDAQVALCRHSLGAWKETVRTLQARMDVGEANEAAVTQATANMTAVESDMVKLLQQISEQENALSLLLGQPSQPIARTSLGSLPPMEMPQTGIPLQVLAQRPDVRQAEHALQAAFYDTRVARAAFYPQVSLSGTLGWANSDGAAIANPGQWLSRALGSIVQPLFNKGRNTANLKIAKARQEAAVVTFRQQLLKAGSEVADALTAWQRSSERLALCQQQIATLQKTVHSTSLLMQHSEEASYLEVLTAQQSLLQAQLTEVQEQFSILQATISLYHAVGGGA